jgi:hypothetical protein
MLVSRRPLRFFDSRGDNRTAMNQRNVTVPVHLGRVPYKRFAHLVFLSLLLPSDASSSIMACVLEEVDLRPLLFLLLLPR